MTLESTACRNRYVGNGTATQFPFTWKAWRQDQVRVFVGDGGTEQDVSAQCAVTLTATGGTVTFPVAPASGTAIAIRRGMPFTQEDDYRNGSRFDAEEVEDRFDQDCAERQQLLDGLGRCVKTPETSSVDGDALVSDLFQARQDALDAVETIGGAEQVLEARDAVLDALAAAGEVTGATLVAAPGSGVARSIASRLADVINVKDFGAAGSGVTDDTAAIQAAIDYAKTCAVVHPNSATPTGAPKVFFPHGRYVITSTLNFVGLQSCWVEFDNAVIVAGAQFEAGTPMLLFKNNWEWGNRILGLQLDMDYKADIGLQIHGDNRGFRVDNVLIHRNGNGIAFLLGTTATEPAGDSHGHSIYSVKVYGRDGDAYAYNGVGLKCNCQDCYLHDINIHQQRIGMVFYGGGIVMETAHIWHGGSPDNEMWDECFGIVNRGNGNGNVFKYVYFDNLACGMLIIGTLKVQIGYIFDYMPLTPTAVKQARIVECSWSTLLLIGTCMCYGFNKYTISPIKITDFTDSWKVYFAAKHRYQMIGEFSAKSFGGSRFDKYSIAFNAVNNKIVRSPETEFASASVSAGYYLIGHILDSSGYIDLHIRFNNIATVDATVRTKISSVSETTVAVADKLVPDGVPEVDIAFGAAVTVSEYGSVKLVPVYLHFTESTTLVTPYVEADNAAHQMFLANMQTTMSDLIDASPTIEYETALFGE